MNAEKLAGIMDTFYSIEGKSLYNDIATMLRQQQAEIEGYHQQALNDSRAISKLLGEMGEKEAEIEALKEQIKESEYERKANDLSL